MPPPRIVCTAQQSRFHSATIETGNEIDLKDVCISIGQNELLSGVHLRLKAGVRYALLGRNGAGKSTLLVALADKLIPGLSTSIRILLLSQVEDAARAGEKSGVSVLEHVIAGDKRRTKLLTQRDALVKAVESPSLLETQHVVLDLRLRRRQEELLEAQKIAQRRSGTRGKEARTVELQAEANVAEVENALASLSLDTADTNAMKEATDLLAETEMELNLLDASSAEARAASILVGLGFSTSTQAGPYSALSGGWRMRCALAAALLIQSDVLILDEPTNFLDLEATVWLERFLSSREGTLIVTAHDIAFLDNVAEESIAIKFKKLDYFEGTPSAWEVQRVKEARRFKGQKEAMDKKRDHIEKSIQQGKAAAKKSGDDNKLRMAKSRQKKLDDRFGLEQNAAGHRFKLNRDMGGYHFTKRAELVEEGQEKAPRIVIPSPAKLRTHGDLVHFDGVDLKYKSAPKPLLEKVTFTVSPGSRIAFVGANGHGKSTLAKLMTGALPCSKGTITRHPQLTIGHFNQHSVEALSALPDASTATALTHFTQHFAAKGEVVEEQDARACLGAVGLQGGTAAQIPIAALSGGQKVRLALALVVYKPPQLLLLDEVTTHVDAPTVEALTQALRKFEGAIVLITHDRCFSRVVVEGTSFRTLRQEQADGIDDDGSIGSNSTEEDEDSAKPLGKTYHVGNGQVRELPRGMVQYVEYVERKLAKAEKVGK